MSDQIFLPACWQKDHPNLQTSDYTTVQVYGEDGGDILVLGDGNDQGYGGTGFDWVYGGAGNDILYGQDGFDYLYGYADNDTIYGGNGVDVAYGGAGNDFLYGGANPDLLIGEAGADIVNAGTGNDWMWGDAITGGGGGGADHFVFVDGDGVDVIYDFEDGIDLIDLSGSSANSMADVTVGQIAGGFTWITYGGSGDVLYLWGAGSQAVGDANITASDFIF
ncbi:MAG: calcium-binding protein [Hyphomicrobiaceae bacterium]|nr:calcium-binding protein [Hyphomicrobiaceae bacterium]